MAAAAVLLAACGGGGGTASNGSVQNALYGLIHLLDHAPADGAVQVPVEAQVRLEFDTPVALDSLGDEDTWLRRAGSAVNIDGSFAIEDSGRTVLFTPTASLDIESDYTFQLSGLTCDNQGRLLDRTVTFGFRTFDETPPSLLQHSVQPGITTQPRTGDFVFTFSEAIDGHSLDHTSLSLRDVFGFDYPGSRTATGDTVVFTPHADLPGNRYFTLTLTGDITDRAGNRFGTTSTTSFTTVGDTDRPSVATMWPDQVSSGISPVVQPTYTFSESMDPGTVEPASLQFEDTFGSLVPFTIHSSPDQRTLRVQPLSPLQANRTYTLSFLLGPAGTTDVSGNILHSTQALQFTTGSDTQTPTVAQSTPHPEETRVSINAVLEVQFDEPLDPAWVHETTVRVATDEQELAAVVELLQPDLVRITPILLLPSGTACTVTLQGGHRGLHDSAGNVMAADHRFTFHTTDDEDLPRAVLMPADGASEVPTSAHVSIVFDAPMDAATMTAAAIMLTDDQGVAIPSQLEVQNGSRVARIVSSADLQPLTYYRVRVAGGSAGVRRSSGSWFSSDRQARFRTGSGTDQIAPTVAVTVNDIDPMRNQGLLLPPAGFTIDVRLSDPGHQSIDMSSIEVVLQGTGQAPSPAELFAAAAIDHATFRVRVPATAALEVGDYTMTVRASDLSGNAATSAPFPFAVSSSDPGVLPFERVQVVWVRSDLDRDGNGSDDFSDDMLRLGLGAEGDPVGANARLRRIVLDGIIAKANQLFGRGSRGEPIDDSSVWLRFTRRLPIAMPHAQIAVGGFDPDGESDRGYGSESSGVLGRAYYDARNGNVTDRNTSTNPGLGVFPGEVWLYQTLTHIQSWPSYQTVFAQRFRPLAPAMGGTPAGMGPLDAIVLDPEFDYDAAPSNQRARWLTIMRAADDWATVIGTILAHEVGHSVGLVAPGAAPAGLFGDSSLHNTYASAAEVMASSVGYEAMLSLDFKFRDIDLAYLRQRVLLR